ncbi:unnamed protein product [Calypogeia fissa]
MSDLDVGDDAAARLQRPRLDEICAVDRRRVPDIKLSAILLYYHYTIIYTPTTSRLPGSRVGVWYFGMAWRGLVLDYRDAIIAVGWGLSLDG